MRFADAEYELNVRRLAIGPVAFEIVSERSS